MYMDKRFACRNREFHVVIAVLIDIGSCNDKMAISMVFQLLGVYVVCLLTIDGDNNVTI